MMNFGVYLRNKFYYQLVEIKQNQKRFSLNKVVTRILCLGIKAFFLLTENEQREIFEKHYFESPKSLKNIPLSRGRMSENITFRASKTLKNSLGKPGTRSSFIRSKLTESKEKQK